MAAYSFFPSFGDLSYSLPSPLTSLISTFHCSLQPISILLLLKKLLIGFGFPWAFSNLPWFLLLFCLIGVYVLVSLLSSLTRPLSLSLAFSSHGGWGRTLSTGFWSPADQDLNLSSVLGSAWLAELQFPSLSMRMTTAHLQVVVRVQRTMCI